MTQTPDEPLIDNPHLPVSRAEFAGSILRLKTTLTQKVLDEIFRDSLTPLDLRTEALMYLVVQLLTGKITPGSMKPEEVEGWMDQFAKEYETRLTARLDELKKQVQETGGPG